MPNKEVILYARTSIDTYIPVEIDIDGKISIASHGYLNSVWQPNPLQLGFSDAKRINVSEQATGATHNVESSAVPTGELWVVEMITGRDQTSAPNRIQLGMYNSQLYPVLIDTAPTANNWTVWTGAVLLEEGDKLRANFQGCSINDTLALRALARIIDMT